MDFSRRLYRWASEGVDMYDISTLLLLFIETSRHNAKVLAMTNIYARASWRFSLFGGNRIHWGRGEYIEDHYLHKKR